MAAWDVYSQKKWKRKEKIRGMTKIGGDSLPLHEPFVSARGGHEAPGPFPPNQVRMESLQLHRLRELIPGPNRDFSVSLLSRKPWSFPPQNSLNTNMQPGAFFGAFTQTQTHTHTHTHTHLLFYCIPADTCILITLTHRLTHPPSHKTEGATFYSNLRGFTQTEECLLLICDLSRQIVFVHPRDALFKKKKK